MNSPFPLRPMAVRDILDEAFDLYRAHFARLVLLSVLICVSLQMADSLLIALLVPGGDPGAAEAQSEVMGFSFLGLLFLAYFIGLGALSSALASRILTHPALSREPESSYPRRAVRFLKYLATFALTVLIYFGGQAVILFLTSLLSLAATLAFGDMAYEWLAWAMLLVYLPASIGYDFLLIFILPTASIEGRWGFDAVQRGIRLFFSNARKTAATLGLLLTLFGSVLALTGVGMGAMAPTEWEEEEEEEDAPLAPSELMMMGAFFGTLQALVLPLYVNAVVVLYIDARVRTEGWDLEALAYDLGSLNPSESITAHEDTQRTPNPD